MSIFSARYFHDEAAAHVLLEEIVWQSGPVCPRCGSLDRITTVRGGRFGLYRFCPCKRQFTVKAGTVFESSHVPLTQWLQVVYAMGSHQVMRTLNVQYKTAWFMTHRIRAAMAETHDFGGPKLGGSGMTIEADETYIGGKAANRAYGPIPPKHAVASLVDRNGRMSSFHVPNVTANNLYPIVALLALNPQLGQIIAGMRVKHPASVRKFNT
nr:transposase [Acidisphaera sp. S103]